MSHKHKHQHRHTCERCNSKSFNAIFVHSSTLPPPPVSAAAATITPATASFDINRSYCSQRLKRELLKRFDAVCSISSRASPETHWAKYALAKKYYNYTSKREKERGWPSVNRHSRPMQQQCLCLGDNTSQFGIICQWLCRCAVQLVLLLDRCLRHQTSTPRWMRERPYVWLVSCNRMQCAQLEACKPEVT